MGASVVALIWTSSTAARPAGVRPGPARALVADVFVGTRTLGSPIRVGFPGLSFEASALPLVAHDASRGNLVALLSSIGPGLLRFGGASVDSDTYFSASARRPRPGTTTIVPADFDRLRLLLTRTGWRTILAVPLARYDPLGAAREAAAASRRLGPSLVAIEIGNEPNAYWLSGRRPLSWGYLQYRAEIASYRRAIAAAAPGVPIAGPDTVMGNSVGPLVEFDGFAWLAAYARDERVAMLTPHLYPLDGCSGSPPTLGELLSPRLATAQSRILQRVAALGRARGLQVRLGETNNVGCGGRAGVSDTFGAAVWAVRYMLAVERSGITGINFHTLPERCNGYSPICSATPSDSAAGRLQEMPEWYALRLMHYLIGDRPLRSYVSGDHGGLTVDALASEDGLDVVIANSLGAATRSVSVRLHEAGRFRLGSLVRLSAPTLESSLGVQLVRASTSGIGLQPLGPAGGRPPVGRGLGVSVPGASVVLVRLVANPEVASHNF